VENKSKFFDALLKTKYGKNIKKKVKQKVKKAPMSLKAFAAATKAAMTKGDIDFKKDIYKGKKGKLQLKANPKKKSIGLWFTKSF
jgi:hypothetical protein